MVYLKIDQAWRQLLISGFFLAFGLYSVISMERDFEHVSRLATYFVLIVPAFLMFNLALFWHERLGPGFQARKPYLALRWLSQSAPQSLIQYVLAFCCPFFSVTQRWPYGVVTILILCTTLWEPIWNKLLRWWAYRCILQSWSLMCASSFLFPFFLPDALKFFYPILALIGMIPLIPTRRHWRYLLGNTCAAVIILLLTLVFPSHWRFPVLSVWLQNPQFEMDTLDKNKAHVGFGPVVSMDELKRSLADDHSLCCLAPVVAPPGLNQKVLQEWSIDGQLIERPELRTNISGNTQQRAFRSFYCKRNFPELASGQRLRCRLYLQSSIYLGDIQLTLQ